MKRRAFLALALAATSAALASPVADIAQHEGSDRQQRLLDGARREGGVLNLYTSLTVEDMGALNAAFEAKYGIRIRMWRAASDKVVQRVLAEARGGRHEVDIVETNAPPLESLGTQAWPPHGLSPYGGKRLKHGMRNCVTRQK